MSRFCAAWFRGGVRVVVRLVHLANWPVAYPGAFVPMLGRRSGRRAAAGMPRSSSATTRAAASGCRASSRSAARSASCELGGRIRLRREVASILSESRAPTILHTHFTSFDIPAALAAVRRPSTAVVWHLQSPARTDAVGRVRGVVRSALFGRIVDRMLCVAPDRAAAAIREGAPRDRVRFFPNAIDASAFTAASRTEREEARTALGLDPDAVVLLHFGWDWQRKGGDIFLRAVRDLLDRGRTVTALSLGARAEARAAGPRARSRLGLRLAALQRSDADALRRRGPVRDAQPCRGDALRDARGPGERAARRRLRDLRAGRDRPGTRRVPARPARTASARRRGRVTARPRRADRRGRRLCGGYARPRALRPRTMGRAPARGRRGALPAKSSP